jgi:hypothetical protein
MTTADFAVLGISFGVVWFAVILAWTLLAHRLQD